MCQLDLVGGVGIILGERVVIGSSNIKTLSWEGQELEGGDVSEREEEDVGIKCGGEGGGGDEWEGKIASSKVGIEVDEGS